MNTAECFVFVLNQGQATLGDVIGTATKVAVDVQEGGRESSDPSLDLFFNDGSCLHVGNPMGLHFDTFICVE
jgi:hypothetical protein